MEPNQPTATVTIGGIAYHQDELTLAQAEDVAALFADVVTTEDLSAVSMVDLIRKLRAEGLLPKALAIILVNDQWSVEKPPDFADQARQIPMSQVAQVIQDFLSRNDGWVNSLKSCFQATVSPTQASTD